MGETAESLKERPKAREIENLARIDQVAARRNDAVHNALRNHETGR